MIEKQLYFGNSSNVQIKKIYDIKKKQKKMSNLILIIIIVLSIATFVAYKVGVFDSSSDTNSNSACPAENIRLQMKDEGIVEICAGAEGVHQLQ